MMRGVGKTKNSVMTTSCLLGAFRNSSKYSHEFLSPYVANKLRRTIDSILEPWRLPAGRPLMCPTLRAHSLSVYSAYPTGTHKGLAQFAIESALASALTLRQPKLASQYMTL